MLLQRATSGLAAAVVRVVDDFTKLSNRAKAALVLALFFTAYLFLHSSASSSASAASSLASSSAPPAAAITSPSSSPSTRQLRVLTWNLAAINNNPFEYWLTLQNEPKYNVLMNSVEKFILSTRPSKDQLVGKLFPEAYVDQLMQRLQHKLPDTVTPAQVAKVREMYQNDWSRRSIISTFVKDPVIGKKRLVSMPDRMTNTIQSTIPGKATLFRPTPINCYGGTFTSLGDWYAKWLDFMFDADVDGTGKSPVQLLRRIPRAKYPDLTAEEEEVSVPLQVLLLGVFDAIQVRVLNQVSLEKWKSIDEWQLLRRTICDNLNFKKNERTTAILSTAYGDADVVFLQEASQAFVAAAQQTFGSKFHVIADEERPSRSDQTSMMLLSKKRFAAGFEIDRHATSSALPKGLVADGDLLVAKARDVLGRQYLLASFHGDTNGLATIPVLDAVHSLWNKQDRLVFGMDGNTYENAKLGPGYQNFGQFVEHFTSKLELTSCWGDEPSAERHTTHNARTFMQPQLSKAASQDQVVERGDANPKDFVLFSPAQFKGGLTGRDNTGTGTFVQNMVFPTLDFPSDHAIVRVVLEEK